MPLNRPSAEELLEAVREWLEREVRPQLSDPAQQYKARVAANVLAIVGRESERRDVMRQTEVRLLSDFLKQQGDLDFLNAQLAEHIRRGELDHNSELCDLLHTISLNKLAIDNPNYSTFKKYRGSDFS